MAATNQPNEVKLVIVGDSRCGKTSLLSTFVHRLFPKPVPTVFDNHTTLMQWRQQTIRLSTWDTSGREEYDTLRPLAYAEASVILICFALDDRDTLVNVERKWAPEIRRHLPGVPVVLVGNKRDARDNNTLSSETGKNQKSLVATPEGKATAENIRAKAYVECSALMQRGFNKVFDTAIEVALKPVSDI